jgi:hypothetical protein
MPGIESFVRGMRRSLAVWLLPELHDLLLERINEENTGAERDQRQLQLRRQEGTGMLPALQPPEDWLARVREGAPQLLEENVGGVPSIRVKQPSHEKGESVAGRPHHKQADSIPEVPGHGRDAIHVASMKRTDQEAQRKNTSDDELLFGHLPNKSSQQDDKSTLTRSSGRMGTTPGAWGKITNALHAAVNAVSGQERRPANQDLNVATESAQIASASLVHPQQEVVRDRGRTIPPVPQSELIATALPKKTPRSREEQARTTEAIDLASRGSRHPNISSEPERRRGSLLSTTNPNKLLASLLNAHDRQLGKSPDAPHISVRSGAHLKAGEHAVACQETEIRGLSQISDLPAAAASASEDARRFRSTPKEVMAAAQASRELQPRASFSSSTVTRSAAGGPRTRASRNRRWPTLIPQPRERESMAEEFHMQQRQEMLRREQSGAD